MTAQLDTLTLREIGRIEVPCLWKIVARTQREKERASGLDDAGTANFKETGCFGCNGKRVNCSAYDDLLKVFMPAQYVQDVQ